MQRKNLPNGGIHKKRRSCFLSAADEDYQRKLADLQKKSLEPIKEDLAEWLHNLLDIDISVETFINVLDNGAVLCRLAALIQRNAAEFYKGKCCDLVPDFKLQYRENAKSGTWFARDNTANFLSWCRDFGVKEECMFESDDLVSHKQEKPVVVCLLELARMGYKFGIDPPCIVQIETEIEQEHECFTKPALSDKTVQTSQPPGSDPKECPVFKSKDSCQKVSKAVDKEVRRVAAKCNCSEHVNYIADGQYNIFGRLVFIRLLKGKHVMVRVGGGWDTLEHYLSRHSPTRFLEFRRADHRLSAGYEPKGDPDTFLFIAGKYKKN